MKKLAVLSGAGVSKESGINTFRDSDGMWEQYRVEEVASIEGWYRNAGTAIPVWSWTSTMPAAGTYRPGSPMRHTAS